MHLSILAICVSLTCLLVPVQAVTVVVDSFDVGDHQLVAGGVSVNAAAVNSLFATTRVTTITTSVPLNVLVTSTLIQPSGTVQFQASGTSLAMGLTLQMRIHYLNGGPYSMADYSAFEFDVAVIAGSGNLIIELGSETAVYGPEIMRIPINTTGTVTVPFSQVNFGPTGSIGSFYAMHFTIEAVSEEFDVALDEIRVVPEPSNLMLLSASAMVLLARRRRDAEVGNNRQGWRGSAD